MKKKSTFYFLILGLDPAAASLWLEKSKYIQKGDALYVQSIHSTSYVGTKSRKSDSDIKIQHNCSRWNLQNNHRLSAYLHEIIAAKRAILIAQEKGKGRVIKENISYPDLSLARNECVVGVYNQNVSTDAIGRKYEIKIQWDDCETIEKLSLIPKHSKKRKYHE